MPNTREKLIELLSQVQYLGGLEEKIADHLIANGVSVKIKKEKPPTDLTGKCGSCVYASISDKKCFANVPSFIRCTNPTKRWLREIAAYKQRTTPCCKAYKEIPY